MKLSTLLKLFVGVLVCGALVYVAKKYGINNSHCSWVYAHDKELKQAVDQGYVHWAFLYTVSMMFIVALSLPIVIPAVIGGGYLFGLVFGAVYAVIGTVIGALVPFLIVRHMGGAYLKERYKNRFDTFNRRIERYGTNYVLVLHYLAIVPFFIINSFAALTNMSLATFIRITILGSFPVYLIYAFAGRELSEVCSVGGIVSLPVILSMVLLLLLALLPMLVTRMRGSSNV